MTTNTTLVQQSHQPACLLATMQPQGIHKNNQGVDFIMSRDFEHAIHCFHESLVGFKSELLEQRGPPSFDVQHEAVSMQQETKPAQMNLFRMEHLVMDSTEAYSDEMFYLKAYLSPFRILHSLSDNGASLNAIHQSATEREIILNLSIAVTILNVAISYHHLTLMENTVSQCDLMARRSRAKALYHKAIQVVRNSETQDRDAKQLEAVFDLVLLISLNNLLLLLREDDPPLFAM